MGTAPYVPLVGAVLANAVHQKHSATIHRQAAAIVAEDCWVHVQELGEPLFLHFFVKKVVTLAMDKHDRSAVLMCLLSDYYFFFFFLFFFFLLSRHTKVSSQCVLLR